MLALLILTADLTCGPFVGHVDDDTATIWARASNEEQLELRIEGYSTFVPLHVTPDPEHDLCVTWTVDGLLPSTKYPYEIATASGVIASGHFTTAPPPDAHASVTIAFGSCAKEDDGTAKTWLRLVELDPDVCVLLGDTPYIDSTDLAKQRERYRAFAAFEPMRALLSTTPWYGTWDDHDFGRNDTDGNVPNRENSRRAFVEYHANASYGTDGEGVHTSFRNGPVEVFLLDTRWFAAMEPSPVDETKPSLLGAAQWSWLVDALKTSTAPVKILASGMIWNEATRPNKPDHWGTYPHERTAVFDLIAEHDITGVILVGGDIHRSRVIRHEHEGVPGGALLEFISSPMHDSIIEAANAPHPGLITDLGVPHIVLLVTATRGATGTTVAARFVDADGVEHASFTHRVP